MDNSDGENIATQLHSHGEMEDDLPIQDEKAWGRIPMKISVDSDKSLGNHADLHILCSHANEE